MTQLTALAVETARGSALASWRPVWVFSAVLVAIIAALAASGRRSEGPLLDRIVLRVPRRLERLTGVPGWAASTLLLSIYGLAFAGYGFYTDVAYHVTYGRDDVLFTAPHTAIFAGLVIIASAPLAGILVATQERVDTPLRWGGLRVPWSTIPLGVLGIAAVTGFPVDELWHQQYGVDVTMWSPPHLVMILAASFSGLASWLVLVDAGVRPGRGTTPAHRRWARGLHVVAAALTLQGLSSVQGEFSFGVPQWQQLYHPVLVCLAAGFALLAIRLVHGPWWALGIATGIFLFGVGDVLGDSSGPVETRPGAVYLGSAVIVEVLARLLGTQRRLRLALAAGLGIATGGLAVEWMWNQGAHQPWTTALLPDALLVGALAAVSAAVLGAAVGGALSEEAARRRIPAAAVGFALVGVLVALAIPAPRPVGDVTAEVTLDWVDDERAVVSVRLDPADAAEDARWFTAGSWQWGGRTIAHMERVGPGEYRAPEALQLTGGAKSLLRLHRGAEMMAVPIRLPADEEYGLDEIPAEDRTAPFVREQQFLQREAEGEMGAFAVAVLAMVAVLGTAWVVTLGLAARAVARRQEGGGSSVENQSSPVPSGSPV
ncbi:MAG TPA: hypothetical protein VMN58_05710 [Acidimicrobiales bacterium]|nr:hypothetical protein [Acidimicrobiales bacterium]